VKQPLKRITISILLFAKLAIANNPNTLIIGVTDLPTEIDPINSMDVESSLILAQVFENLYEYDENDQLVSSLLKGHQISPNGKTYRFFLKENLKFHDNTPIDSVAVIHSLTTSLKNLKGNAGWALQNIVGYKTFLTTKSKSSKLSGLVAIDPLTIEVHLSSPFRLLLHTLTARNFAIFRRKKNGSFLGSGSYRLGSISKDKITLTKIASAPSTAPSQLQFHKSDGSFATAEKRKLDVFIPPSNTKDLPKNYKIKAFNSMQAIIIIFNTHSKAFANNKTRCAIINRLRSFFAKSYPNQTPALASLNFGSNSLSINPDPSSNSLPNSFTVDYVNSSAFFPKDFLKALQSDLSKDKIKGNFRNNSVPHFLDGISKRRVNIAMLGWAPDYIDIDAYLTPILRSNEQYNFFKYKNETIDALLDLGREMKDPWDRSRIYQSVMNNLSKSCVVGFLGGLRGEIALSDRVTTPKISGLGIHGIRFRNWSIK